MAKSVQTLSSSAERTVAVGQALGELLRGGEIVELCGPLGAGKTRLAKGLARGLGVPHHEHVVSPTFVLAREYAGRRTFLHCDAYRLGSPEELLDLGLDEALESGAVVAIEWADRFPRVMSGPTIRVDLDYEGENSRRVGISGLTPELESRLTSALAAPEHAPIDDISVGSGNVRKVDTSHGDDDTYVGKS